MDLGWEMTKVALSLLLVLALLGTTAYGLKRFGRWTKRTGENSWIEVLGQHPVGLKHYLLLVRVREQLFFLGVSPQGIHMLSSFQESAQAPPGASEGNQR